MILKKASEICGPLLVLTLLGACTVYDRGVEEIKKHVVQLQVDVENVRVWKWDETGAQVSEIRDLKAGSYVIPDWLDWIE